ncbi:Uncharacterized protein FWK35_00037193, partial [Aphis craccivora]
VYRRVGETRSFLKTLKKTRAKLIGHVLHHNNLFSKIIDGAIEGNNSRGPPLDYISQIVRDIDCRVKKRDLCAIFQPKLINYIMNTLYRKSITSPLAVRVLSGKRNSASSGLAAGV